MVESIIGKEVAEELALARSKVRRRMTYLFGGILAGLLVYGVVWMGDRSALTAAISTGGMIIAFWFGSRGKEKPQDNK